MKSLWLAFGSLLAFVFLVPSVGGLASSAAPAATSCPTAPLNLSKGKNVPFQDVSSGAGLDCDDDTAQCHPFATIQGTVFNESGESAAGVQVVIEAADPRGLFTVTTDKTGRYTYSGLHAGRYIACVNYRGGSGLPRQLNLKEGRLFRSDFDLKYFERMADAVQSQRPPR